MTAIQETATPGYAIIGGIMLSRDAVVLLEDDLDQVERVRGAVESRGRQLFSASDWQTAVEMAACGARFFVLDIKMGQSPEQVRAGLKALEALRARYQDSVFVAILSALTQQYQRAMHNLHPNIALEKTSNWEKDIDRIFVVLEQWAGHESAGICRHAAKPEDVNLLFPSDSLALRIAGATQGTLERLQNERVLAARALGRQSPKPKNLVREIGNRMRDELRGALRELAERGVIEHKDSIELANGMRLSNEVVRLLLRLLPITYGVDDILERLSNELHLVARHGIAGEWGSLTHVGDQVILIVPKGGRG